jgi:hypothetical protein
MHFYVRHTHQPQAILAADAVGYSRLMGADGNCSGWAVVSGRSNVTACIFWLKNRDPQHWRDSQQMEHVLGKYIISDQPMTPEDWARERADVLDAEAAELLVDKPKY